MRFLMAVTSGVASPYVEAMYAAASGTRLLATGLGYTGVVVAVVYAW